MNRVCLLGLLSVFCMPANAGPQINVGTVYDYLDADKSTYLNRVFNSGDSTAFVKVNVLEIVYDDDRKRFKDGESDKTVADAVGGDVLWSWVSAIREELFGPDTRNQEIEDFRAELRRKIHVGAQNRLLFF